MEPENKDLGNIPNGYVDVFEIRPQARDAKSEEELLE